MQTSQQVLLHLSLCDGIGPIFIQRLVALGLADLSVLYTWTVQDWIQYLNVDQHKGAHIVAHLSSLHLFEEELALMRRACVEYITVLDDAYPDALRAIHAPPPVLYYRGSIDALNSPQPLAIIGSRAANSYGVRIIKDFVPDLVQAGCVIVSGGALGADSVAHTETLVSGGTTVAVLGSGLSHLYPKTNKRLFEDISAQGGAVISAFPMSMEPLPGNFPSRNRIISGLSRGCLVVQAAEKSGTRITAQFALQQGRDVFVVPGQFDDPLSAGCHALAREGATLVTSAADILYELGISPISTSIQKTFLEESTTEAEKQLQQTDNSPATRIKVALRVPLSVDELAAQLGLEHDLVQQHLWDLRWQGVVQQDITGRWHF